MSALTVAGAGLGVYLGKSAIAEMNPAYFTSPVSTFHADLVAAAPNFGTSPLTARSETFEGLGTGCVRCPEAPVEFASVTEVGFEDPEPALVRNPEIVLAEIDRDIGLQLARRQAHAGVERYAHYPLSAEEEQKVTLASATAEAVEPLDAAHPAEPTPAEEASTERPGESLPGI
jgi:hypothetical protein